MMSSVWRPITGDNIDTWLTFTPSQTAGTRCMVLFTTVTRDQYSRGPGACRSYHNRSELWSEPWLHGKTRDNKKGTRERSEVEMLLQPFTDLLHTYGMQPDSAPAYPHLLPNTPLVLFCEADSAWQSTQGAATREQPFIIHSKSSLTIFTMPPGTHTYTEQVNQASARYGKRVRYVHVIWYVVQVLQVLQVCILTTIRDCTIRNMMQTSFTFVCLSKR